MSLILLIAITWLFVSCAALGAIYRRPVVAAWREPALRAPVLIFESDDWGYGPEIQRARLDELCDLLSGFADSSGRHPVMTLGVVLAGPDTEAMRESGCADYRRLRLADFPLTLIREAMLRGAKRGVFAVQLHGMEHYWPPALMSAAGSDPNVRSWLIGSGLPMTESLPSPLQSRWMDASVLPSNPLSTEEVTVAVVEEVREFERCFGVSPKVVVPPTFAWTADVQAAWAGAGIEVLVSSGERNPCRDKAGRLQSEGVVHFNGATGADGVTFVVRNDYFEPDRGHTHRDALDALKRKTHLGRPTLMEIHRSNFVAGNDSSAKAMTEMRMLLETACRRFPNLMFMSTEELVSHLRQRSGLVETRCGARLQYLLRRLGTISRLRKLAWITGAIVIAWCVYAVTWRMAMGDGARASGRASNNEPSPKTPFSSQA